MKVPFIDLSQQYHSIQPEIDQAIKSVLESGNFASGPFVASFEKNFALMHKAKYCVAVNSGTAALHIAMWALGLARGYEVIVPTHTFIATASAVNLAGATPVFVDCEEQYYNIDPEKIEKSITKNTRAIIPVHLYGQPAQIEKIKIIADQHNLNLIEDCAQAHCSAYKGKPVGTTGICGCFSFYPTKNLGAYGEGGAVLTNDEPLAKKMSMLRNHGSHKKYDHSLLGHNYRMEEMQAALLNIKLKHLNNWIQCRKKNAALYRKYLKDLSHIILPEEMPEGDHVYHLFVIRTKQRDNLMEFLEKNEISTGIHYPIPCHLQSCYAYFDNPLISFPIAEQCAKEIISLPMYPELTESQIQFVSDKIKEFFYV
jgi:dTDP-4-amino-4,6-dideoxygalactose transaminase